MNLFTQMFVDDALVRAPQSADSAARPCVVFVRGIADSTNRYPPRRGG